MIIVSKDIIPVSSSYYSDDAEDEMTRTAEAQEHFEECRRQVESGLGSLLHGVDGESRAEAGRSIISEIQHFSAVSALDGLGASLAN